MFDFRIQNVYYQVMKLTSNRRAYWEFGKYISEHSKAGLVVQDVLRRLEKELEGTDLKVLHKRTASRLKTAYETYVEEYGFAIDEIEDISALDLCEAYTGLGIVQNRKQAVALIDRLNFGEKFNRIRAEYNISKKPKAEHYIEAISISVNTVKSEDKEKLARIKLVIEKYKTLIQLQRKNPSVADRLFVEYNLELIELALNK